MARPFGVVLRDLLIDHGRTTAIGNPNWSGFCMELNDVSYESLRKAVTNERPPSVKIMEAVAAAVDVAPTEFAEYRLAKAREQLDPDLVGLDEAMRNLERLGG